MISPVSTFSTSGVRLAGINVSVSFCARFALTSANRRSFLGDPPAFAYFDCKRASRRSVCLAFAITSNPFSSCDQLYNIFLYPKLGSPQTNKKNKKLGFFPPNSQTEAPERVLDKVKKPVQGLVHLDLTGCPILFEDELFRRCIRRESNDPHAGNADCSSGWSP